MHERVSDLIRSLELIEHPEGGYFREVFRSSLSVHVAEDGRHRDALTTIYYLLASDDHSRWHSVDSDEVWHYYEGAPLELLTATRDGSIMEATLLARPSVDHRAVHTVPAGYWQAARSTGEYSLVGCTVGPGFDFDDFRFLKDDADMTDRFKKIFPKFVDLI